METTPLWFRRTLLVCHQLPLGGHSSDPLALSGLVEWKLLLDTGGYRFCSRSPTFFWFFVVFQNFFCLCLKQWPAVFLRGGLRSLYPTEDRYCI